MPDDRTIDFSHQERFRVTVVDRRQPPRVLTTTPQRCSIGYGDAGGSASFARQVVG